MVIELCYEKSTNVTLIDHVPKSCDFLFLSVFLKALSLNGAHAYQQNIKSLVLAVSQKLRLNLRRNFLGKSTIELLLLSWPLFSLTEVIQYWKRTKSVEIESMQKKCHLRSRLGQPGGAGVEARTSDQEVPGSNPRPGGDFGYLLTTPTLLVPTLWG